MWHRYAGTGLVMGAAWALAADASATEVQPLEPVRFLVEAPQSCVSPEQFVGRVLDYAPHVRAASDEELARTFRISLAQLGDVTAGVANGRLREGGTISLSVQGECEDVADALTHFVVKSLSSVGVRSDRSRHLSNSNPYLMWQGPTAPPLPQNPYLEHRGDSLRPRPDPRRPSRPLQNSNPYRR